MAWFSGVRASLLDRVANAEECFNMDQWIRGRG